MKTLLCFGVSSSIRRETSPMPNRPGTLRRIDYFRKCWAWPFGGAGAPPRRPRRDPPPPRRSCRATSYVYMSDGCVGRVCRTGVSAQPPGCRAAGPPGRRPPGRRPPGHRAFFFFATGARLRPSASAWRRWQKKKGPVARRPGSPAAGRTRLSDTPVRHTHPTYIHSQ